MMAAICSQLSRLEAKPQELKAICTETHSAMLSMQESLADLGARNLAFAAEIAEIAAFSDAVQHLCDVVGELERK